MDELLKDAMSFIQQAQWKDADQALQKVYSSLPKDPCILIRSIIINCYLTSETIPTDQKTKIMVISAGEPASPAIVRGGAMVKSAVEMANQVHLESNELFLDIIRCFLDIGGRFLFSEVELWQPVLDILIETSMKIKVPNTWLILLLMADAFSKRDSEKKSALKRLDAVFSVVESDQESADTFYACILATINTDFLEKIYPTWESNSPLNLLVKITRYHSDPQSITAETFTSLQNDLKIFINANNQDNLSKALNFQSLILKLASIALKCDMPDKSKELLSYGTLFERNSSTFILKEYLLAEISLYDLEKSKVTDLVKRSRILTGLSEAVDIASKSQMCIQIINQGCLLIWNVCRPYFPIPRVHKYRELIKAFKICANALDISKSSLKFIRAKMHYELSRYFFYQDFIPNALNHVNKGLKLSISNDHIDMDLRLLQILIEAKNGGNVESSELRAVKRIYLASESKELSLAVDFAKQAIKEFIPEYEDKSILKKRENAADVIQLDQIGILSQDDQIRLGILEYLLQCIEELAESFSTRLKSNSPLSENETDLFKKLWGFRVAISDFVLDGYLKNPLNTYYQEKKASIYIIKARSLQKAFFEKNSRLDQLEFERNTIIESLLNCCHITKDFLQFNAVTELWNFYQKHYKEHNNTYWTSIFQKLYLCLQEATVLHDYSLFKYIAGTYALMLLREAQEHASSGNSKDSSKPKVMKGTAKGGKEDTPLSYLLEAEEIINESLIKAPYMVESQLFLISVWCQLHCTKSDKNLEPISNIDEITNLFSCLEISGLSFEKREGLSVDDLLKKMIFTALASSSLPIVLRIEIIARISQFAITENFYSTASGCLEAGFEAISSCKQICSAISEAKMLLELVKSQFLICLLSKKIYLDTEDVMIADSFKLSMSALKFGLKSESNLPVDIFSKLVENIVTIMENVNGLEKEYFIEIRMLFSSFKRWPRLHFLLQNPIFLRNIESIFVVLSDLCFGKGWNEDGIAVCDLSDKIIPKSYCMILERYKWLSWTGKQSCFLRITPEEMSLVWLSQAKKARDYNKKMRAFELCMKESKGSRVELESIICFLEWKEQSYNVEKYQLYRNRLREILNLEHIPKRSDGSSSLIAYLRATMLLFFREPNIQQIQSLLQFAVGIVLELLQSTLAESIQMMPREEIKEVTTKGKKDAKEMGNNKNSQIDLPKELNDWINFCWPPTFQQCFNECKKEAVFCASQVSDRSALLNSLLSFVSLLSSLEMHGSVFLFTKLIALISKSELLGAVSLIDADALICMEKKVESKMAFKTFFKSQLAFAVAGSGEDSALYPRSLFLQAKILLKHGYALEARNVLIKARNVAQTIRDEIQIVEIDILLGFLNIFFGNFGTTKNLISNTIGKCPRACMLMDASLTLLFSEKIQSGIVSTDIYYIIDSVIDQVKHKRYDYSDDDVNESLFTLNWIQLRLLPYIQEMTGKQKFQTLTSLFETCTHHGEKTLHKSKLKAIQSDYIIGLWDLFKEENENKNKRLIRNLCIGFIISMESKFIGNEDKFDLLDYQIIQNILKIELDHLISSSIQQQSKTVDDILDDFLVNITDPPLQMTDSFCKLISRIPMDSIPEKIRGEFICFNILYQESELEKEIKLELLKECISKLYLSRNYALLKIAVEKYLHLIFSEASLAGLRSLAQLQALDSVSYLRQTFFNFKKATFEYPIVEIFSPWISRFTKVSSADLYSNLGNARLNSIINPREDLNFGLLPKSCKILILQHSSDKKSLFVGALKRKSDCKQKGNDGKQKILEEYDISMIISDVNVSNLSKIEQNIFKLKSCGNSGTITEFDESSTRKICYSYLSCLSESKELKEILSVPLKAESSVAFKSPARNTKTADKKTPQDSKKGLVDINPQIETDHLIVLCDDLISLLPIESFLQETFGIQSISRDFCLQTVLDRYSFGEPSESEMVPSDPKKKEKSAILQSEDKIQATGISCLMDNNEMIDFFTEAAKIRKGNPNILGYAPMISSLEMRSLVKDYSLFLYSGKSFDESILEPLSFLKSPRIAVILEHGRPKNQGTDHILYSRQKKVSAILTLLGFDSVILTNCNLSKKGGEEMLLKILDGSYIGKIALNSIFMYSTQNDACPVPEVIAYGINLPIDY